MSEIRTETYSGNFENAFSELVRRAVRAEIQEIARKDEDRTPISKTLVVIMSTLSVLNTMSSYSSRGPELLFEKFQEPNILGERRARPF